MWNMNDEKYSMNIFMNMSSSMRNVIKSLKCEIWMMKSIVWTYLWTCPVVWEM